MGASGSCGRAVSGGRHEDRESGLGPGLESMIGIRTGIGVGNWGRGSREAAPRTPKPPQSEPPPLSKRQPIGSKQGSKASVRAGGSRGLRAGAPPMDSLLFLCARRVVAHRPLPVLPADLHPVLFQAAFLDGRPLVLRDLVAAWPFPVLNFQRLVGRRELLRDHPCKLCVQAVILAVVAQLRRQLEEPGHDASLRVLDITGLPDSASGRAPAGMSVWSGTVALAKACVEVSKHQREFQRRGSKRHKGRSGAATAAAAPQPPGVDVHADLFVNGTSYGILRDALQTGSAGPLRLKCRELQAEELSASAIAALLESLDPSFLRRVDLRFNNLGLAGLSVILPHLSRFPELRSLKLQYSNVDVRRPTPESAIGIRCLAGQLGMLPSLRELNLGSSRLSGNLRQILCDLQAPLESLELAFCSLVPADLAFLSQSFHAPALKRLDLSGHDFSQGLLEPLRLLLEETSASLLHLDLMECRMADPHLDALLPTLRRCSRLRFLGLYGNSLSTAALKELLHKTLELPDLRLVVYPFPVDCYRPEGSRWGLGDAVDEEMVAMVEVELGRMLEGSGRSDLVWSCNPCGHGELDFFAL
ncbi:leucine-rich repeat-containing protein 14-like [Melospiza georgiana]|uniref:leucine-rich repeat-containing protein 14-like n=1 Tax=Melospiza georgiana TaxID=44398 RepID=UPI0025AC6E4C|nr:leucine-rich repeat-containing protein 14-like [Melospiza georgiana]